MQIDNALINGRLSVSKVTSIIYNFAVIYQGILLFSWKVAYILTVSIVFLFVNKMLRLNNLETSYSDHIFRFIQSAWLYL